MDYSRLPQYLANARERLFTKGHVNQSFVHMETVELECSKEGLVERCIQRYLDQADEVIKEVQKQLENTPIDFGKLENSVNLLRTCTNTVGADRILTKVNRLVQLVKDRKDILSCKSALEEIKVESKVFESEMNDYFLMLWNGKLHSYNVDVLISAGLLNPVTLHRRGPEHI